MAIVNFTFINLSVQLDDISNYMGIFCHYYIGICANSTINAQQLEKSLRFTCTNGLALA